VAKTRRLLKDQVRNISCRSMMAQIFDLFDKKNRKKDLVSKFNVYHGARAKPTPS